jgi:guanylate kinase
VQIFIAPPEPAALRERLTARGKDSVEAIDARLAVAAQELAAQDEFAYRVVNDELDRATDELERIVRAELVESDP